MTAAEHEEFEDAEHDGDNGYEEAMKRLAVLKSMPVESLTDAERKEKLRLANRESARKMRRKQAEQLQAAEVQVHKLEAESSEYMNKLAEGWHRYKEIKNENELLRGELQALQTLQATMAANGEDGGEANAEAAGTAGQAQNPAEAHTGPEGHQEQAAPPQLPTPTADNAEVSAPTPPVATLPESAPPNLEEALAAQAAHYTSLLQAAKDEEPQPGTLPGATT